MYVFGGKESSGTNCHMVLASIGRHVEFQNGRHLETIFAIISRSNAAINLNSGVGLYMCKIGACITTCTILEYLGNTLNRIILLMHVKCLLIS